MVGGHRASSPHERGSSTIAGLDIDDPAVVTAYYHEYEQIFALSEPLDWSSEYVDPEWRIGS